MPRLPARVKGAVRALLGRSAGGPPQLFPPGEFYSPIVDTAIVLTEPDASRIWPATPPDPPGIDLRAGEQLALLNELSAHRFDPTPLGDEPSYDPANDQFPPHDAAVLYAMVRHLRPRRMVEVGCGWSTTVTARAIHDGDLDTELTCIDPYPRELLGRVGAISRLRRERVEHSPPEVFEQLGAGDVLFIDSSHVAKTGSDVVHQLLHVVPRLSDGVVVHLHDVFIPEDYPQGWVRAGFNWNEQYVVQAYLSGNARTEVLLMNHWLALRHPESIRATLGDLALTGSSLWFRHQASRGA